MTEPSEPLGEEADSWTGRSPCRTRAEPVGHSAGFGGNDRNQDRPELPLELEGRPSVFWGEFTKTPKKNSLRPKKHRGPNRLCSARALKQAEPRTTHPAPPLLAEPKGEAEGPRAPVPRVKRKALVRSAEGRTTDRSTADAAGPKVHGKAAAQAD